MNDEAIQKIISYANEYLFEPRSNWSKQAIMERSYERWAVDEILLTIKDKYIPMLLGAGGIVLCGIWVLATSPLGNGQEIAMAVFTAIVQGILMAGLSNYVNQIIKQANKNE